MQINEIELKKTELKLCY